MGTAKFGNWYQRANQSVARAACLGLFAMVCGASPTARALPLSESDASHEPGVRMGTLPTPSIGLLPNKPGNAFDLGKHRYRGAGGEKGIIYTCDGGFLDLAHMRKAADWTAWLQGRVARALREGSTELKYSGKEPSRYTLKLDMPTAFTALSAAQREQLIPEISTRIAVKLAHIMTSWHEVITWYGWKSTLIISEKSSAFSYEDVYSNFLGSTLAAEAILNPNLEYDQAMTAIVERTIQRDLRAIHRHDMDDAFDAVKGSWWKGGFGQAVPKRMVDMGSEDGSIEPWVIRDLAQCPAPRAKVLALPDFRNVAGLDLSQALHLTLRPKIPFMLRNVLGRDLSEDRDAIEVESDWPAIEARVKSKIEKELGEDSTRPY